MPQFKAGWLPLALLAGTAAVVAAWLDARYEWITPAFDWIAHQFYEIPILARFRRPSQLILVRWHLAIGSMMLVSGLLVLPWLSKNARIFIAIFGLGYAILRDDLDLRKQPAARARR